VLFKLVQEEVLASYSREFEERVRAKWEKTQRYIVAPEKFPLPNVAEQIEALNRILLHPSDRVDLRFEESYAGISVAEIVNRGIHRLPPANKSGEELRDVVLWLAVLEYAKREKREVAFITNDSGFWREEADEPLVQIAKDVKDAEVDVGLLRLRID